VPKLLEGGLADTVYKAARSIFLDATLSRDSTTNVGTPFEPATITNTTTFSCKAIEDQFSTGMMAADLVNDNDVRVLVLANSLATTPQPLDRITIRGRTYTVVPANVKGTPPVQTDPARATWSLRCS
jgi:hypothetical protein